MFKLLWCVTLEYSGGVSVMSELCIDLVLIKNPRVSPHLQEISNQLCIITMWILYANEQVHANKHVACTQSSSLIKLLLELYMALPRMSHNPQPPPSSQYVSH